MPSDAPQQEPQVQHVVHHHVMPVKSPGAAVMLELLPGLCQIFGIGNIYAGNVAAGILLMLGYWVSCVVNFFLCAVFIGFITGPLTWIAFMVVSSIMANKSAVAANQEHLT